MTSTILVIPDGASQPVRDDEPTALEAAVTPALDGLARDGELLRVRTIPEGMDPGTEVGLPRLLGLVVDEVPSRGRLEAAAAGIDVPDGMGAWRLDVRPARELTVEAAARLAEAVGTLGGQLHALGGHRHLLVGPAWWGDAPPGPHQTDRPLRELARGPFAGIAKAAKAALRAEGEMIRVWPWGRLGRPLGWGTAAERHGRITLITTGGVAEGVGRLAGGDVVRAAGADAVAAAVAALQLAEGGGLVVVHDGGADDAAHDRDPAAKIAALERLDRELLAPLARVAATADAEVIVAPDHGCDPATGDHDGLPVPAIRWRPGSAAGGGRRCTERAAADAPLVDAPVLVTPRPPLRRDLPLEVG